jgi:hypothetical protein
MQGRYQKQDYTIQDIEYFLIGEFDKLCSHYWDSSHITISKAVGKDYKTKPCPGYDERTHEIVDAKKYMKRLQELGIRPKSKQWRQEYYEKVLPAHAQLANRMKRRGIPVEPGTRLEYIMVQHEDIKAKTFQKIEDPHYQKLYSDILRIDFLYIMHLAINPLDQLLETSFKRKKFVEEQYNLRLKKHKLLLELMAVFSPTLKFVDTL